MVDLVGKRFDELIVQRQTLLLALILFEVLDERVGQFVPQFALPEVFEIEKVVLNVFGGGIALFGQQVGDCVDVHLVSGKGEGQIGEEGNRREQQGEI